MQVWALVVLFLAIGAWAQTGGAIEGTVTDSATHAGVPGVNVTLRIQGVRYTAITTDSSGSFRVTGTEPGEYNLRFDKPGFVAVELPALGKPRLRVGLSGTVRADVEMLAMATLRGRVLDPEGKPAPKITVGLGPLDFATNETDAEGVSSSGMCSRGRTLCAPSLIRMPTRTPRGNKPKGRPRFFPPGILLPPIRRRRDVSLCVAAPTSPATRFD